MSEARILTCVYCGHEYPQKTPAWNDRVLTDHIAQCEKHPMRAVIQERDRLRSALAGMIGESDPAALRSMELAIRTELSAPDEDKAVAINAIHALLNRDVDAIPYEQELEALRALGEDDD